MASLSSHSNSITLFQLSKKDFSGQNLDDQEISPNADAVENEDTINIMCIINKHNKIGAAYYNFNEKMLYAFDEMADCGPQFASTIEVYHGVKPKYVLSFGNIANEFIKMLTDLMTARIDATASSDSVRSLPKNLVLLPLQEYSYEVCQMIVSELDIASNRDKQSEIEISVHINSLINFAHKLTVQAIGSIVKYLDKNWATLNMDKEELIYLHIHQISRKDHVWIDETTTKALRVFSRKGHDASFKHGLHSSNREGLSIFKLFSANCKSSIGLLTLKNLLQNPVKKIDTLNMRLDFINFCLQRTNREFIESLQDNMKHLGHDIHNILTKISNARAMTKDWHMLYKTIRHMILINDLSAPYREKSQFFMDLHQAISLDLIGLENSMENAFDFNASHKGSRPTIKFGLDENLDAKKLRQQDIAKDVEAAARLAANNLPDFLTECAMVYLPEMGHLVAIKEWEPNCNPEELAYLGYEFMFNLRGKIHYKSPLCIEMDRRLGDINSDIIDHENRILRRLSGFILRYNKDILEPFQIMGLMDCLISMAVVANQNEYVRPVLNEENIFEIADGRHALMEHIIGQFQSNDFYSGGRYSHMKIITGPNGCGKSVYLKQITLVIFLAHIGSYVPAKAANIAMLNSIHSRMQTTESAAVRLSSFMLDVTQISVALYKSTPACLIVMDEFGRGTTEEDGIAILVGVLKKFLEYEDLCPHILVSTHFQQIISHLPSSPLIDFQKMKHTKENGGIYFLFKVAKGVSNSYALDVAESVGLDAGIIARAREILDCLKNNKELQPLESAKKKYEYLNDLTKLNIPEPDKDE